MPATSELPAERCRPLAESGTVGAAARSGSSGARASHPHRCFESRPEPRRLLPGDIVRREDDRRRQHVALAPPGQCPLPDTPRPRRPSLRRVPGPQERFRLTTSSICHGCILAVPRRGRLCGARCSGEAGKAGPVSKNHGSRRDRPSCRLQEARKPGCRVAPTEGGLAHGTPHADAPGTHRGAGSAR